MSPGLFIHWLRHGLDPTMSLVGGGKVEKEGSRGVSTMKAPFLIASFKNETHN